MNFGPGMRAMLLFALYFSCIGILMMLSGSPAMAWLSPGPDTGYSLHMAWFAIALQSVFIFAVPAVIYANVFPQERFRFFRFDKPVSPLLVLFGMLAMIILIPGIDQVATWISNSITNPEWRTFEDSMKERDVWFTRMPGVGDLLLCILANALVPAVCEELFFRAGIQQILMERARSFHIPIWASALIFAMLHSNPSEMPLIFLAGLLLGYAFYWTGSIRINILMHFAFNGFSILEIYLAQHNETFANWEPGIPVVIASFIGAAGFMFLLWKFSRRVIGN